ncbi:MULTISPECIES: type II toxin-antitoxin system Phd/YefM family antitoxin [Flavobacterium]|uniref:Antitoxin n=1 Tax=Flavobacterium gawalongense TaxID=2594432 RepID=A0A553BBI7_9FLAO|nr:type II toxin-antitoxin system prevent-host-death family antitoxin [Flavobacterium gawalongense]TRW98015.1 type II toxin-antitoxin system prevent-host-death family antitoxin [Flavobacterium gawalongense]TRX02514.1 type II toxin-antitoxin system prevent-host-death family antitoxin [Flavobacterium gawalongense]TRX05603.1 type II toxin-antitoxin system prevent-host-death family antitoxin [Flavobacterium gawalongense]TRX06486.1 type II toxin-antitoxin system prevent-host-death family antitoxin [
MKVINYTDLRLNLKKWMDSVIDDMEEIIVKRKDNKDLVLISLDEYNSLKETNYLLSGKNREILLKAVEDVKNKKTFQKELIEE